MPLYPPPPPPAASPSQMKSWYFWTDLDFRTSDFICKVPLCSLKETWKCITCCPVIIVFIVTDRMDTELILSIKRSIAICLMNFAMETVQTDLDNKKFLLCENARGVPPAPYPVRGVSSREGGGGTLSWSWLGEGVTPVLGPD